MADTTADRVVVELEARNEQYDAAMRGSANVTDAAMSQVEKSVNKAEVAIRNQAKVVQVSSGAVANAQRNLGRQIADVGTQLASGSSPFLILAQQAPQVADALADTGGRAGRVAAFFAGPWGAALLAAASVAGTLTMKLFEQESAHKAVEKAADAAAEAEKALQDVLAGTIQSSERARIAALDRANASRFAAIAAVNEAKAQLALARAIAAAANASVGRGAPSYVNSGGQSVAADVAKKSAEADLADRQRELNAIEIRVKNLQTAATAARGVEAKQAQDKVDRKAAADRRRDEAAAKRVAREAEQAAKEEARNRRQAANDIGRSSNELLAAEADLTADTAKQDEVLRQRIRNEQERAKADIDANPIYTAKERERLKALEDQIAQSKLNKITLDAGERLIREELSVRQAGISNERDQLEAQGELATTLAERRDIALRLVDLAYQQERAQLEAIIASKTATEAERKIAQARLGLLDSLQAKDTESARRRNEGPLADYRRQFEDLDTAIEQVEANSLRALEDGLTRATVKALGLKGALGDVVGQLIQIGIQRAIIGPIADALFGSAGGGGGILGSVFGSIFGRASGGYVAPGQTVRVNEHRGGVELLRAGPQGADIIPLGQTRAARAAAPLINQHITIQAPNSILASEFIEYVDRRSQEAAQAGAQGGYAAAMRDVGNAARPRL